MSEQQEFDLGKKRHKCDCRVCQYGAEVRKHLNAIEDENARLFFEDLYEDYCHTRMDRDYYSLIVEGQWPSAREVLSNFWPELKKSSSGEVG